MSLSSLSQFSLAFPLSSVSDANRVFKHTKRRKDVSFPANRQTCAKRMTVGAQSDSPQTTSVMRKANTLSLSLAILTSSLLGLWSSRAEVTDNESIPVSIFAEIPCANGGAGESVQ